MRFQKTLTMMPKERGRKRERRRDVMKNGRYRDGNGTQKAGKLVKTKEANQEIKAREGKRKGGIAGGSKSREV